MCIDCEISFHRKPIFLICNLFIFKFYYFFVWSRMRCACVGFTREWNTMCGGNVFVSLSLFSFLFISMSLAIETQSHQNTLTCDCREKKTSKSWNLTKVIVEIDYYRVEIDSDVNWLWLTAMGNVKFCVCLPDWRNHSVGREFLCVSDCDS